MLLSNIKQYLITRKRATLEDMARLGLLILHQGIYDGNRKMHNDFIFEEKFCSMFRGQRGLRLQI